MCPRIYHYLYTDLTLLDLKDHRDFTHTTGLALFAECRIHSAKALLHSAKSLPSVALGKPHSVKKVTAKAPLPSVFFRALGKVFAECQKALGKLFETILEKQRLKIAKYFIFTR